jgi:hypothetical protein
MAELLQGFQQMSLETLRDNNVYNYEMLEKELQSIISFYQGQVTLDEVADFVDFGEYGVAYDLLCSLLIQDGVTMPKQVYERFVALGKRMELDEFSWERLLPIVVNSTP